MPKDSSPDSASAEAVNKRFATTRRSLIEKLANWEDQRTWDEFYQTYWRLIYSVSTKSGLSEDEAFDVVQETVLTVAKQWKKGQTYDPEKGSFKSWLLNITRWRIADQFRKNQRNPAANNQQMENVGRGDGDREPITVEMLVDESSSERLNLMWEQEWKTNLSQVALGRIKKQVAPKQYQIFDAYVIKGWDVERVKQQIGVSSSQVYLAKHRVGSLVKQEINKLKDDFA